MGIFCYFRFFACPLISLAWRFYLPPRAVTLSAALPYYLLGCVPPAPLRLRICGRMEACPRSTPPASGLPESAFTRPLMAFAGGMTPVRHRPSMTISFRRFGERPLIWPSNFVGGRHVIFLRLR